MTHGTSRREAAGERSSEAGFTLIEALMAIVILVFGLVAVTNLLVVAGNSSQVANAGTTAAAIASEQMELLKATSYLNLVPGGSLTADTPGYFRNTTVAEPQLPALPPGRTHWLLVPGAATINVRWVITQVGTQAMHIRVQAEAAGTLLGSRTRADFTSFRACTSPVPNAGVCNPGVAPCCPAP